MNFRLTKIAESGVQYRQIKRWTASKPSCDKNTMDLSGLAMYEFAPHLLLLTIGMGISIIIFVFEKVKWIYLHIRQEKKHVRFKEWTKKPRT